MTKIQKRVLLIALICFVGGFVSGWYVGKRGDIPFVKEESVWSIGIYTGIDPLTMSSPKEVANPVLSACDVTDIQADFVSDPFMIRVDSFWYMFFEVMNSRTKQSDIGLAVSSNGLEWQYRQIVLDEPHHLSYPYVFEWDEEYYMVLESYHANSVRLYRAVDFPTRWEHVETLIEDVNYVDPTVFRFDETWWLFASSPRNDVLHFYYADRLAGPWRRHPQSPLIDGDANMARPGGRVLVLGNRIIRCAQDDYPTYGNQVRAFEVTSLTRSHYEEREVRESPILKAGSNGWNKSGMHTIDAHMITPDKWIACVDGYTKALRVEGIYSCQ